ncbi:MAG: extracellular solute-binding protein, partial [Anaerolinea sp.]|nr:extracellular solute-binding protein [Anaerolinea sp.]
MSQQPSSKGLSRRDFLKALTVGGAGAAMFVAGVPIASGAADTAPRAQGASVTLQVAGNWPFPAVPATPPDAGYTPQQQAVMAWLEQHPNVRIEGIEAPIWGTSDLRTLITGGTAPSYFHPGVLAVWTIEGKHVVFNQGLLADLSNQFNEYDLESQLADSVKAASVEYEVGDAKFGLPEAITPGNGIFFRRDIFEEKGIEPLTVDSTWEEIEQKALALTDMTRIGMATQYWGVEWLMSSEGFGKAGLFNYLPNPSADWNWRFDYTSYPAMVDTINRYRRMIHQDRSLASNFGDWDLLGQFYNGTAAIVTVPLQFFTEIGDIGPGALANQLGRPLSEVVGAIPHARGTNGHISPENRPGVSVISVNPDYSDPTKSAAVNLYQWMILGEGFEMQRRLAFETTGNLQRVYSPFPFVRADQNIEGVTGTPAEAWGQEYIDLIEYTTNLTNGYPMRGLSFPPEMDLGPTESAWSDATSLFRDDAGDLDVLATLRSAEDIRNRQTNSFSSDIPDDQFIAAAQAYYQANAEFWQAKAPDFYENTYRPWYEQVIVPIIG